MYIPCVLSLPSTPHTVNVGKELNLDIHFNKAYLWLVVGAYQGKSLQCINSRWLLISWCTFEFKIVTCFPEHNTRRTLKYFRYSKVCVEPSDCVDPFCHGVQFYSKSNVWSWLYGLFPQLPVFFLRDILTFPPWEKGEEKGVNSNHFFSWPTGSQI